MSQRTICEFNHDCLHEIKASPELFVRSLLTAINSGDAKSWELLRCFGLKRAVQCHHSDARKAVVNDHEYHFG